MQVFRRSPQGTWIRWRVGRRYLAWLPRLRGSAAAANYAGDELIIAVLFAVPQLLSLVLYLVNWLLALLATPITLPWRMLSGRWPVVAYDVDDRKDTRRQVVRGRAAARALAQDCARHIERTGELPGELPGRPLADVR